MDKFKIGQRVKLAAETPAQEGFSRASVFAPQFRGATGTVLANVPGGVIVELDTNFAFHAEILPDWPMCVLRVSEYYLDAAK